MSEEIKEKHYNCSEVSTFIKIIFASFLGCILAILLVGAFGKPKMGGFPCPCMHKMHIKKIMDKIPPMPEDDIAPFVKKNG
jgi:hypothetical protein